MNETLELTAPGTSAVALPAPPVDVDKLDTAKPLTEIFQPYQTTLDKWAAKVDSLVVTSIDQRTEMAQARLARLELRAARIGVDKARIGLVENLKARTSKIDSTARAIREKIESLEAILLESEEFAERHAAKVRAELKAKREAELTPWLDVLNAPFLQDLSLQTEKEFAELVEFYKFARQAKIDAAAKAEADRLAKEAADRAERERIAAENARLKEITIEMERKASIQRQQHEAEAAEQQRLAQIERKRIDDERAAEKAKADAELKRIEAERKAERDKAHIERLAAESKVREESIKARAKYDQLQAELHAKRRAEAAEAKRIEAERVAQEKEAKRAAAAPDKIKLQAFAGILQGLELPQLSNFRTGTDLKIRINALIGWVDSQIDTDLL